MMTKSSILASPLEFNLLQSHSYSKVSLSKGSLFHLLMILQSSSQDKQSFSQMPSFLNSFFIIFTFSQLILPGQLQRQNINYIIMSEPNQRKESQYSPYTQMDFVPPTHQYLEHEPYNSAFFKDHCEEQYQIQRAFNTNNFTSLRTKIPNQLKHGVILEERLNKVQQNSEMEGYNRRKPISQKQQQRQMKISRKKMEQVGQLGYFEVFPYQQSFYGNQHEIQMGQKQQSKRKRQFISQLQFRPSGFDKKMKYENPFTYVDRLDSTLNIKYKEEYIYPFHLPQDTFDRFHQSQMRNRFIQEAQKIAGEFIPAGNEKSLAKVSKSKAPEIIKQLQNYIKKFLPKIGFFIGLSKKDHIDILFEQRWKQDTKLDLIMSRICENELLSKYLLRRNALKWSRVGQSGYLQYCLLPPWVKDSDQKLSKR